MGPDIENILKNSSLPWEVTESKELELGQPQITDTCIYGERQGTTLYICDMEQEGPCNSRFKMFGSKETYCSKMIDK